MVVRLFPELADGDPVVGEDAPLGEDDPPDEHAVTRAIAAAATPASFRVVR
jgi:hypothetical protein